MNRPELGVVLRRIRDEFVGAAWSPTTTAAYERHLGDLPAEDVHAALDRVVRSGTHLRPAPGQIFTALPVSPTAPTCYAADCDREPEPGYITCDRHEIIESPAEQARRRAEEMDRSRPDLQVAS